MSSTAEGLRARTRPLLALVLLILVTFLTGLGISIMTVAYPAMVDDFTDWSPSSLSWITNAFTIVGAGTLIPAGAIADRTGRKRILLIGVALFTAGSILGGLAPGPEVLIVARCLQALGASAYTPAAAALLIASYPPERLSFAVGIWAAAGGVSSTMGPSLGGVLVEWGGWPWAFWINVPIGLTVLILGPSTFVDPPRGEREPIPDLLSAAILMAGLSLVILSVVQGDSWGWTDAPTLGVMAAGLALVGIVILRSTYHPTPLLELPLFRIRSLRAANIGMLVFAPGWFAMFFGLVLFMTRVWDYSILHAGVMTAPVTLLSGTMGVALGGYAGRVGHRWFIVAGALGYVATAAFLWIRLDATPDPWATMLPALIVMGITSGMAFPSFMAATVFDAPSERHGVASAIGFTTQRIATSLGVALAATILASGDASSVESYDRLFAVMVVTGIAGAIAGSFVDTSPGRRL